MVDAGGQVFNVKAYGAKCDGTTDDMAAIQAAINAASLVSGTVLFPPCTSNYIVKGFLTFPEYVKLKSNGGAVLDFTGYSAWAANQTYDLNQVILDSNGNGEQVTTAGTAGATVPAWSTTVGGTTQDGTAILTDEGSPSCGTGTSSTSAGGLNYNAGFIRYRQGNNIINGLSLVAGNPLAGTCILNIDNNGGETSGWRVTNTSIIGGSTTSTNTGIYAYAVDSFQIDHNVLEYLAADISFGAHTIAAGLIGPKNTLSWGTDNSQFLLSFGAGGLNCFNVSVVGNTFEGYGSTNGISDGCANGSLIAYNYMGDPSATGGRWIQGGDDVVANYIAGNGTNVTGLYNVGVAINNWVYAPSFLASGGIYIANIFYVGTPTGCAVSLSTGGIFDFEGNTFYNTAQNSVCGYANGPNWTVKNWGTNTDNTTAGLSSNVEALLGQLAPQAFAGLPACSSQYEGNMEPVTDSSTATVGATITGGGTNHVLGYCDGTNWTVMAQ